MSNTTSNHSPSEGLFSSIDPNTLVGQSLYSSLSSASANVAESSPSAADTPSSLQPKANGPTHPPLLFANPFLTNNNGVPLPPFPIYYPFAFRPPPPSMNVSSTTAPTGTLPLTTPFPFDVTVMANNARAFRQFQEMNPGTASIPQTLSPEQIHMIRTSAPVQEKKRNSATKESSKPRKPRKKRVTSTATESTISQDVPRPDTGDSSKTLTPIAENDKTNVKPVLDAPLVHASKNTTPTAPLHDGARVVRRYRNDDHEVEEYSDAEVEPMTPLQTKETTETNAVSATQHNGSATSSTVVTDEDISRSEDVLFGDGQSERGLAKSFTKVTRPRRSTAAFSRSAGLETAARPSKKMSVSKPSKKEAYVSVEQRRLERRRERNRKAARRARERRSQYIAELEERNAEITEQVNELKKQVTRLQEAAHPSSNTEMSSGKLDQHGRGTGMTLRPSRRASHSMAQ